MEQPPPMASYELILPADFDEHEWEVEAKGWFAGASIIFNGYNIPLCFYDPARLVQEVESSLSSGRFFFEKNLIVVNLINRKNLEEAVDRLFASGELGQLDSKSLMA